MVKVFEKEKALELRKRGTSINDIAQKLKVSKSTVSYWCRDIVLSSSVIKKIARKSKAKSTESLLEYAEKQRRDRIYRVKDSVSKGEAKLGSLDNRDIYCIGLGLYWGEGYKKGSQEFGFTNSDAQMILFYIKWLRVVFNIKLSDLILRVSINDLHKNRINDVMKFWSTTTNVPLEQFSKPSLIKTQNKKIFPNMDTHMGTLRVKVRKGTSLRREVLAAIDAI